MAKNDCLILFSEVLTTTQKMTDAQFGILIRAVLHYRFHGKVYDGEDIRIDQAFQTLANQVDREEEIRQKRVNAARAKWDNVQEGAKCADANPAKDAPIPSHPIHSHPVPSDPIQNHSDTFSPAGAAKKHHGRYGWVRLSDEEYVQLEQELGSQELNRCIAYVDESAQANGNRNEWTDFAVVIRKCASQGWGLRKRTKPREDIPKGASGLGAAEMEAIARVLREDSL